jgi:hypothetical protein
VKSSLSETTFHVQIQAQTMPFRPRPISSVLCLVLLSAASVVGCGASDGARNPPSSDAGSDASRIVANGGAGGTGNPTGRGGGGTSASGGTSDSGGTASSGGTVATGGSTSSVTDSGAGDSGGPTCVADLQNDSKNCGKCGNVCGADSLCTVGRCTHLLVTGMNAPEGLTVFGSNVYVAAAGSNNVYSIPAAGGAATPLCTSPPAGGIPHDVLVMGGSIYWADGATSVLQMPLAGGAATVISSAEFTPYSLAAQGNTLFWVNHYQPSDLVRLVDLSKKPLAPKNLATAPNVDYPTVVVANATYVVWANAAGSIWRAKLDGTAQTSLGSGLGPIYGLTMDATDVYYTTTTSNTLGVVPISGAKAAATISDGEGYPLGMTNDATYVYWVDQIGTGDGKVYGPSVRRIDKTTKVITTLSQLNPLFQLFGASTTNKSRNPQYVAVDATNVYWTDAGATAEQGSVFSTAKN